MVLPYTFEIISLRHLVCLVLIMFSLDCCDFLNKSYNTNIKHVKIDEKGKIDLEDLDALLKKNKNSVVSLMHGNNEIGNINDLKSISKVCDQHNIVFHSDTVQTVGHYPINLNDIYIHGIVGSAHKFHGPKGVGFSFIRKNLGLDTFIFGGPQEKGLRAGTEAVHNIIGMQKAFEMAHENFLDLIL